MDALPASFARLSPDREARAAAEAAGFRLGARGTHSSRTIMLAELEAVLAAAGADPARADYAAWPTAIRRARDGADLPLQPVGYADAVETHPVCRQALAGLPFGWPRDAVDAALIALHRDRHLSATLNGAALRPGALDQNRIAKAEFRVERAALPVQDRLALRKLFQSVDLSCRSGEEDARAVEFLDRLAEFARAAGGAPPLPASPATTGIEDVRRLAGNERLAAIHARAGEWEGRIAEWRAAAETIAKRLPAWSLVERLAAHTEGLPEAAPQLHELAAIRDGRQLLAAADPAAAIRKALAGLLRAAIRSGVAALEAAHVEAARTLDANEAWSKTAPDDRAAILAEAGLAAPEKPDVATDEALADGLDRRPLAAIRAETDAVPARAARAVEQAARLLEPEIRPVALERATLRDAAEVEAWTERQKKALLEAVADGPVLVN